VETGTATLCHLQPGDVVVADSAYGTYVDLALVHSANADAVFGNIMRVTVIFVGARSWALAIILSNGSVLGDVLNQCLQKTLEHYQQASKCGSPFIDSTTGVSTHRNHLVTTLVDPKRYPKAKLAHLYQLRWQATEVNFKHLKTTLKMEMILPKPNGAERNLDAFACVQLAAKLDVAIGAAIAGVALADVLARSSTTVQSVQTGLAQTTAQNRRCLYSTLLHVISDQLVPLRPHRAEPRVTEDQEFSQNAATSLRPQS